MQLTRSKSSGSAAALFFFALLWNAISLVFVVIGFTTDAGIPFALCGLSFLGIGLLIVSAGVRMMMASWKVADPDLWISLPELRVGDKFKLTYRQKFKGRANVNHITLKLVLRESATYQRGTDTVTVTHDYDIKESHLPARHYNAGETISQELDLQIPPSSMHTFKSRHNELRWLLTVDVDIADWPDFERAYDVTVLPS